jgi:hypothetical protein
VTTPRQPAAPTSTRPTASSRGQRLCAIAGVVGAFAFTAGWLIGETLQGAGYDPGRDDISELGALTAPYAWVMLVGQAIGGIGTVLFALGALRPALRARRAGAVGSWLLALSALGLDNISDVLFRLDCRTADGCTGAQQTASWHGHVHAIVAGTVLLFGVAPFVLARAFRQAPGWSRFVWPSRTVGVAAIVLIVIYLALSERNGAGYVMRALALVMAGWMAAMAVRTLRLGQGRQDMPTRG